MPIVIELTVLCFLSACWLTLHGRVTSTVTNEVYHVAAERRDGRKAKFYFSSVWVGLIAAFFSARILEGLAVVTFDSSAQRSWIMGSLRGAEMWGLLVVGAVWSRVGHRVSRPNSDGTSLVTSAASHTPESRGDKHVR